MNNPAATLIDTEVARVEKKKSAKPQLPGIGHNVDAGKQLLAYIDRIERLEGEKSDIATDIKEIYQESKAFGYDPKIIRKIVSLRKIDEQKRREADELLATYMAAVGMT